MMYPDSVKAALMTSRWLNSAEGLLGIIACALISTSQDGGSLWKNLMILRSLYALPVYVLHDLRYTHARQSES
jgi:hypothetical protein